MISPSKFFVMFLCSVFVCSGRLFFSIIAAQVNSLAIYANASLKPVLAPSFINIYSLYSKSATRSAICIVLAYCRLSQVRNSVVILNKICMVYKIFRPLLIKEKPCKTMCLKESLSYSYLNISMNILGSCYMTLPRMRRSVGPIKKSRFGFVSEYFKEILNRNRQSFVVRFHLLNILHSTHVCKAMP